MFDVARHSCLFCGHASHYMSRTVDGWICSETFACEIRIRKMERIDAWIEANTIHVPTIVRYE